MSDLPKIRFTVDLDYGSLACSQDSLDLIDHTPKYEQGTGLKLHGFFIYEIAESVQQHFSKDNDNVRTDLLFFSPNMKGKFIRKSIELELIQQHECYDFEWNLSKIDKSKYEHSYLSDISPNIMKEPKQPGKHNLILFLLLLTSLFLSVVAYNYWHKNFYNFYSDEYKIYSQLPGFLLILSGVIFVILLFSLLIFYLNKEAYKEQLDEYHKWEIHQKLEQNFDYYLDKIYNEIKKRIETQKKCMDLDIFNSVLRVLNLNQTEIAPDVRQKIIDYIQPKQDPAA